MDKNKLLNPIENISSGNFNVNTIVFIVFIIIYLITFTFIIILHYSMYTWTEELEKTGCECSDLWHRNVIHWVALILLIIIPMHILLRFAKIKIKLLIPYSFILFILFILKVFYISIIFDYITKLKKLECECSESWKREYGYIGSIVYIGYLGLILLIGILSGLMYFFMSK